MKHDLHCSAQVLGEKQQKLKLIMLLWFMLFISNGVNVSVIIFLALNLLCEVFFFSARFNGTPPFSRCGVVFTFEWKMGHQTFVCFVLTSSLFSP